MGKEETVKAAWPGLWGFGVAVVSGCWVVSQLSILSWLIWPLLAVAVGRACRRGAWGVLVLLLLGNPLAVWCMHGMVDYAKGAPKLLGMGLPEIEDFNIDRETRCEQVTGGCLMHGHEWVIQDPHNLGVRVMVGLCGFPRKSYDGPYPTKEQALHAVAGAPKLDLREFVKGRVEASGRHIELDPRMVSDLAETAVIFELMEGGEPDAESGVFVQAVVFEERCLILRLVEPDLFPTTTHADDQDFLILMDLKCLRPFAYFRVSGRSGSRFPKARYQVEDSR